MGPVTQNSTAVRTRRHDPERRDHIIDACLTVIADRGLAGTSHRRVAALADVPLGSMTYHFTGMDDLLHEAFIRFIDEVATRFEARMDAATTPEEAERAVVAIIDQDVLASHRELVLSHELYTLAARDPSYRGLTDSWMRRSRRALERRFDPLTARLLDALIEGLTIHRALATETRGTEEIREAVARIVRTGAS